MKLGLNYNVFDGEEFLEYSIRAIRDKVHYIVCVTQIKSWNGTEYNGGYMECIRLRDMGLVDEVVLVSPTRKAFDTERMKRNRGLQALKDAGCDYYLIMDCDEFYDPTELGNAMQHMEKFPNYDSSVCKMQTYFRSAELTVGLDNYYVNFITKLNHNTTVGNNRNFRFVCDPTRVPDNVKNTCEFNPVACKMHHYSWVRKDEESIIRKCDNSTAGKFVMSKIKRQWDEAKEGYFVPHYGKQLEKCERLFGIDF